MLNKTMVSSTVHTTLSSSSLNMNMDSDDGIVGGGNGWGDDDDLDLYYCFLLTNIIISLQYNLINH